MTPRRILGQFIPIFLFIAIFAGSGIYFSLIGKENAFSLFPPVIAIIPSIILAWIKNKKTSNEKTSDFITGIGHENIIYMCIIFLLAEAFGEITKEIGCVESVVNFATSLIPARFLLVGVFLVSAFLSLSIGSALGTIAAICPIAAELCLQTQGLSAPLAMGTVVGGAFFGDNLSIISDTTIAAISSQGADVQKKFKINLRIAFIATVITIIILWGLTIDVFAKVDDKDFSLLLPLPYIIVLVLAFSRVNVFVCLMTGITLSGLIGCFTNENYGFIDFCNNIDTGFKNANGIVLLSMMIGGLSGLMGNDAIKEVGKKISAFMISRGKTKSRLPQFVIGGLIGMLTMFLANNVIPIIFCGETVKKIAQDNGISPHYSATILEVFACGIQGLLPYGVQVLLAASIANISPLSILPYTYYCYALMLVGVVFILLKDKKDRILN